MWLYSLATMQEEEQRSSEWAVFGECESAGVLRASSTATRRFWSQAASSALCVYQCPLSEGLWDHPGRVVVRRYTLDRVHDRPSGVRVHARATGRLGWEA